MLTGQVELSVDLLIVLPGPVKLSIVDLSMCYLVTVMKFQVDLLILLPGHSQSLN